MNSHTVWSVAYMLLHLVACQHGAELEYNKTFCTSMTMPVTSLCGDNQPIIVDVYQYEFAGEEYEGRPCVYDERDCGRAVRRDDTFYVYVMEHCDRQTTCGGFYIQSVGVCFGRYGDYVVIRFQCTGGEQSDTTESAAAIATSASSVQNILTTKPAAATTPDTADPLPTTGSRQSVSSSDVTVPESGRSTLSGSMSTSSSDGYDERAETLNSIGIYAGIPGGILIAVLLTVLLVVVCLKRKKRQSRSNVSNAMGSVPIKDEMERTSNQDIPSVQNVSDSEDLIETTLSKANSAAVRNENNEDNTKQSPDSIDTTEIEISPDEAGYSVATPNGDATKTYIPMDASAQTDTGMVTIPEDMEVNGVTELDYATVRIDNQLPDDRVNDALDTTTDQKDTRKVDMYASVRKDTRADDELEMHDNPSYVGSNRT